MIKRFSEDQEIRHHPQRAVQAWQILVGAAMNRQTFTYKSLSHLMYGHTAAGVLDDILAHIAYYCIENDLPPLTAIVVNSETGMPGDGIPVENVLSQRESVFNRDWFDVYPPNSELLRASFQARK